MKKFFVCTAIIALVASFALTGCLSSGNQTQNTTTTITMYDNCPNNDYARSGRLLLRAASSNYTGTTSFTYTDKPNASSIKPVLAYSAACETIRKSIEEGYGACTLTFNTKADGSGQYLNFSNTNDAIASVLLMSLNNYTEVYAIYTF